jgi:hypothetical protein
MYYNRSVEAVCETPCCGGLYSGARNFIVAKGGVRFKVKIFDPPQMAAWRHRLIRKWGIE